MLQVYHRGFPLAKQMLALTSKQRRETAAMQYLIPTPEGEQPELRLAYLVVGGQFIPVNRVSNTTTPKTLNIVTVEQESHQQASQDKTEGATR